LIGRPEFAAKIAAFETELIAVDMMVRRAAALHGDQGHFAHAFGSMLKIRGTDLQQRMSSFLVEMLGHYGAFAYAADAGTDDNQPSLPGHDHAAGIAAEMFFRRASTIYGGASEVQRGIIAKLMFGF
jgi:acyl-CoA dehydrogenase